MLQWSNLFSELKGSKAIYNNFSLRFKLHSKNENALIIDIQVLNNIPSNEIISALAAKLEEDLIVAKFHFSRGKHAFLEVILQNKHKLQLYLTEGISLFKQTLFRYIPINLKHIFLSVKIRNIPIEILSQTTEKKETKDKVMKTLEGVDNTPNRDHNKENDIKDISYTTVTSKKCKKSDKNKKTSTAIEHEKKDSAK
ncbi:3331_t:CDS:2, partial [Scutellospora calospora]